MVQQVFWVVNGDYDVVNYVAEKALMEEILQVLVMLLHLIEIIMR
jgi:hypothetical protein